MTVLELQIFIEEKLESKEISPSTEITVGYWENDASVGYDYGCGREFVTDNDPTVETMFSDSYHAKNADYATPYDNLRFSAY